MILKNRRFTFTLIFCTFFSFPLIAQHLNENLPLYGGVVKSKEEAAADNEFVKETISLYGTRDKAFITFVDVGWKSIIENKLDESVQDFNKAWLLFPENADTYFGFSLVMFLKKKHAESDKLFNQGIILDKEKKAQKKFYLRTIDFAGRKKDTLMMIKFLTQSLSVDSVSVQTYQKLAYYTSLKGMYKEALAAYSGALRINPDDSSIYYNRGLIYRKIKKFNDAISDFDRSIKLSRNNYLEAILNRGITKYDIGDYKGSIEDYNICIKINSKTAILYRLLGISQLMVYDSKAACISLKTAKKLGDKQAEELYNVQCK